jgi:hypothetical protein
MRPLAFLSRPGAHRTAAVLAGFLLVGCAGSSQSTTTPSLLDKLLATTTPAPETTAAPTVEKESCGTPAQCRSALKKMVDNPKRGWVGQQQAPAAYTDGTRLFAYRALRTKLNCRELTAALTEVRGASKSLAGEVPGVSANQVSRTRALNGQVESELAKERGVRCKS